ncbi:hypothetical protein I2W78_08375 [Streptomyces spinoverrucosus]|uniref:effector-associated domain 2-containing protein n=1 Tax=Streptomyces spinoverrucosus TaxID=284043 RepID=UPI0018C3B111|nr:hypothetical protein [Streptomyces spinoverrucosus]MBG0851859.1 hypothetical protein [Streptomyces spinoverrucosus]
METAAGLGEFGRASARDLLFRLTEALCGLSCLEDQAGRQYFAGVLSEQLNVPVDVRGVKQREDVVILVRTALSVPQGERVLADVVRVACWPAPNCCCRNPRAHLSAPGMIEAPWSKRG